jgi:Arc/MetJ family transcription regulator
MRTTLEIDDELLKALLARHPGASKREAVERAIRSHLSKDGSAGARALRGRLPIEDVAPEMRGSDRRT